MSKPTISRQNRAKFSNVQSDICRGVKKSMESLDNLYTSGTTGRFGFHYRMPTQTISSVTRNCFDRLRQKNKGIPGKGEKQWFWEGSKRWSL
jgi:hypothetical protein